MDPLAQYAKLRQQLLQEKSELESRLKQINGVLGDAPVAQAPAPSAPAAEEAAPKRPGRRGGRRGPRGSNTMSLRDAVLQALAHGPVGRKDIVKAVQDVGYKFTTNNPLNSIGAILYGKNSQVRRTPDGAFVAERSAKPSGGSSTSNGAGQNAAAPRKKRKKMSAAARARIGAAQRARWAKQRAGN